MYKCLIIDDEPLAIDLVAEYLEAFPELAVVGTCLNGFEAARAIHEEKPDLIFLDVQMPKLTGFELLSLLEDPPAVIFTTAYDQYALQAFEQQALDYLLKPYSEARFRDAVQRFLDNPKQKEPAAGSLSMGGKHERLVIKDGPDIHLIPFAALIRVMAEGDYVKLFTTEDAYMKKQTLQSLEQELPADRFVRVHRSHLIHLAFLKRVEPYGKNDHLAIMKDGDQVPVSRSGYQRLRDALRL